ncbi:uncharacterized protein F5Z01DRAFT_651838, partial [Emericellopsis atlantica]
MTTDLQVISGIAVSWLALALHREYEQLPTAIVHLVLLAWNENHSRRKADGLRRLQFDDRNAPPSPFKQPVRLHWHG